MKVCAKNNNNITIQKLHLCQMRFLFVHPDNRVLTMVQQEFGRMNATSELHWVVLKGVPEVVRRQLPSTAVFLSSSKMYTHTTHHFDGVSQHVKVPTNDNPYAAFWTAIDFVWGMVWRGVPVDLVVVTAFGPPTRATIRSMRNAFLEKIKY